MRSRPEYWCAQPTRAQFFDVAENIDQRPNTDIVAEGDMTYDHVAGIDNDPLRVEGRCLGKGAAA
ncbi:hypothetical protein [Sodalis-like endosymbiont of Proechinophthirus fluctus]|uniref:hypothetical protein n=1 Tax=Sodalis-like endosymbiont of Proechinophthirus fluctus TaxID=1462730 RepID=UPI0034E97E2E